MARKKIQDMIKELRSWLPNYDHKDYPTTLFRLLASLPGGEELEDMGYEPMPGISWHEADQLGRVLEAIQDKEDVEDLVAGLIHEEEEVEERGIVRDNFRDPKGKKFRLTFLPYAEMKPYNNGFTSGRFEEFFRTRFEAQTRMRQLIDEGRIEEAEIHESVSVPSGSGSSQGGTISMRLVDQWHDTGPNARKDRRTGEARHVVHDRRLRRSDR